MILTTEQTEFFATKKALIYFETLEIYHPNEGVLRFVKDQQQPKSFTLESDAPRNAGETVAFNPVGMSIEDPSVTAGVVNRTFTFSRIGNFDVKKALKVIASEAASGSFLKQFECVYRVYIQGSSTPSNQVEYLYGSISIDNDLITITASDDQPVTVRVAVIENVAKFPGLKGVR